MTVDSFFIHRVKVQRGSYTKGNYGGATKTDVTTSFSLPGRMVPLQGQELLFAQQLATKVSHAFYCGPHTGVREQDEIVFNSKTFRVQAVLNPDKLHRFTRIDLEETRDGAAI